jgi:hypothetical protein
MVENPFGSRLEQIFLALLTKYFVNFRYNLIYKYNAVSCHTVSAGLLQFYFIFLMIL